MSNPPTRYRPDPAQFTLLLQAAGAGDPAALEELFAHTYGELRELANAQLRRERAAHTLQATALVHEAFLRLSQQQSTGARTPAEFFGVAALAMRRILVDHARHRGRQKRGGGRVPTVLEDLAEQYDDRAIDMLALDEALSALAQRDANKAKLVELRFFAGLSMIEVAQVLGQSLRSLERDWVLARAFLHHRIGGDRS